MRRPILITAWIIAAFSAWLWLTFGALAALQRRAPGLLERIVKSVPDIVFFSLTLIVGPLLVMSVVGYLGLRGKLPGTRKPAPGGPPPSAFPVVPPSPID